MTRSMKTSNGMTCLKAMLMIFTIIFFIIGLVLLASGIYSKLELSSYILLSTIDYSSAPYVMIGFGVFISLIGLVGCFATIKGNTCLLRTYGCFLGIIFIAELVGAIAVIILRGKIGSSFNKGMLDAMKMYNTSSKHEKAVNDAQKTSEVAVSLRKARNYAVKLWPSCLSVMVALLRLLGVEQKLHCCGASNYTDYWLHANWSTNTVPQSCCKNITLCANKDVIDLSGDVTTDKEYVYDTGCPNLVFKIVDDNLGVIIGSMFGVAFFQVIGLVLACCLASTINSNKYELV